MSREHGHEKRLDDYRRADETPDANQPPTKTFNESAHLDVIHLDWNCPVALLLQGLANVLAVTLLGLGINPEDAWDVLQSHNIRLVQDYDGFDLAPTKATLTVSMLDTPSVRAASLIQ